MPSHRTARRDRRRSPQWSTRLRAALCLGVVLVLGATGTLAYWTDEATIVGGPFQSGNLDLTAGPTSGSEFLGGLGPNTWDYAALTLNSMIPGDSVSKTVVVRNSGVAPFRLNGTVTTTTNALTTTTPLTPDQGIQVVIVDQATATASTTNATTGVRTGGCSAGTTVYSQFVSTTSTGTAIFTTPPTLTPAATPATQTRNLCVRAVLSPNAPNALQGQSTSIRLNLTATQLGAP